MTAIALRYLADGVEKRSVDRENEDYYMAVVRVKNRVRVNLLAKKDMELITCSFKKPFHYRKDDQIFLNGYQSWTDTREYDFSEEVHSMNRVPQKVQEHYHFESYGDAWFWQYHKKNFHSFTYSYVRRARGKCVFIGSLNDHNAFLIIHHKKDENEWSVRSDVEYRRLRAGERFTLFDFVVGEGDTATVMRSYFERFGKCRADKIRGYTSWYLDYQDINEKKMLRSLEQIDPQEFDLFQIDDGYETFVGDWQDVDPVKFPNGLQGIVEKTHKKGLKAGIWLAPFVCELDSRLYKEHPDWILRYEGEEVFAGSNWSGDVALDLRRREVRDHISQCLTHYMDMGFDFFKLDFLYSAAMIAGCDDAGSVSSEEEREDTWYGLTRAGIMRKAMEFLREVLGDKLILGCGVPLSSAFNLVDYCRIGPDVSLKFDDVFYMRLMHRERVSTKTTLQNTIYRSAMDGTVFRCDPDVYLLRDDHISLSREQRRALVVLNHLCGSVYLTSDQVGDYDDEKRAVLEEARALSGARILDIARIKNMIAIRYESGGQEGTIVYDRRKGVLV